MCSSHVDLLKWQQVSRCMHVQSIDEITVHAGDTTIQSGAVDVQFPSPHVPMMIGDMNVQSGRVDVQVARSSESLGM